MPGGWVRRYLMAKSRWTKSPVFYIDARYGDHPAEEKKTKPRQQPVGKAAQPF